VRERGARARLYRVFQNHLHVSLTIDIEKETRELACCLTLKMKEFQWVEFQGSKYGNETLSCSSFGS